MSQPPPATSLSVRGWCHAIQSAGQVVTSENVQPPGWVDSGPRCSMPTYRRVDAIREFEISGVDTSAGGHGHDKVNHNYLAEHELRKQPRTF